MLLGLALAIAAVYAVLCLATYDKSLLPKYIREQPHDDWAIPFLPKSIQPWAWIPRRWTSWVLPMPPTKVAGNAKPEWVRIQGGYPLAADAMVDESETLVWSMHPVHASGQWSIQAVKVFQWAPRVPCYFTASLPLAGKRLHVNCGIKPDVTTGDWHFGFPEASVTWD